MAGGKAGKPQPIATAPIIPGTRILAFVKAAESANGWMEMIYAKHHNGKAMYWASVIDHPFPNACLEPVWWLPVPAIPTAK